MLVKLHLFSITNKSFFRRKHNFGTFKIQIAKIRYNHGKQRRAVLQLMIYFPTAVATDTKLVGKKMKVRISAKSQKKFYIKGEMRSCYNFYMLGIPIQSIKEHFRSKYSFIAFILLSCCFSCYNSHISSWLELEKISIVHIMTYNLMCPSLSLPLFFYLFQLNGKDIIFVQVETADSKEISLLL